MHRYPWHAPRTHVDMHRPHRGIDEFHVDQIPSI